MFSKATANFIHQIDPEGSLIHVSRVNNSHKLALMALVVKRKRIWFWQKPKYQPTDFTLSDLLQGDKELSPEVTVTEFLTYKGTYGDKLSGKLDTEAGSVSLSIEGHGSTKIQSSFGKLNKEDLDVKKLLEDSEDSHVNMQHVLMQQLKKRSDILGVVKERILTTATCSVSQIKKEQCTFQGMLGIMDILGSSLKVCVKDRNNLEANSDVSLEIPPGTVIAYSILELEIKKDGHYAICLQPDTIGGIETDTLSSDSHEPLDVLDGSCNGGMRQEEVHLSVLLNDCHETDLSSLQDLPQSTQWDLFRGLREIVKDSTALSYLQETLEDSFYGETPDEAEYKQLSDSQRKMVTTVLSQLDSASENSRCGPVPVHLNAAYQLISAMEELPDETRNILSECRTDLFEAFNTLICRLKESGEPLCVQCFPALLQDNQAFQTAEKLLRSINVTLKRDADCLRMEIGKNARVTLLVLYLCTFGLSLLSKGLK